MKRYVHNGSSEQTERRVNGGRGFAQRLGAALRIGFLSLFILLFVAVPVACDQVNQANGLVQPAQEEQAQNGQNLRVPLQIVEAPNGSVLALVPVFVQGEGPFPFALDTGASQSVVDQEIAQRLNLPTRGTAGDVTGVTGQTQATQIHVEQWRVGDVQLPSTTIISLDLPEPDNRQGIAGLLGSDMLSEFGAITVDYENEVLILRERPQANAR